jgi:subtilisin-like proprotein convertase family protein
LKITLTTPLGTAIVLHDRNGGGTDNLQKTFDLTSTRRSAPDWKISKRGLGLLFRIWRRRIQDV